MLFFAQRNRTKQEANRAECTEAIVCDYANVEVASKKQLNVVFCAAKPPKAMSRRKRVYRATRGEYATVEEYNKPLLRVRCIPKYRME